jgi:hypothetical protein
MPWATIGYEQITTDYADIFKKIGQKKFEDQSIPHRELMVRTEVLRRDITKRQLKIISMILTLSYYLGKEHAIIPKMRDFEIAGISKIKVRTELIQLVELDVINWDEEKSLFSFKDVREWKLKFNNGYNHDRATELFELNVIDAIGPIK